MLTMRGSELSQLFATVAVDPSQVPGWVGGVIVLILLPFFSGVVAAVFLRVIVRWAAMVVKIGSVLCVLLAVLGYLDLRAASSYSTQLWMAIVGLHSVFSQRIVESLMIYPVSAASLATGLCIGLLLTRGSPWRNTSAASLP
ncbi:MAG: hypothetical protein C4523_13100 [Myxococcales bacterium]|nr:MAG: hypothetical protein C4523_13100 [Myxococcales bacterium]